MRMIVYLICIAAWVILHYRLPNTAGHATGIEGDNDLVERARANAEYNNITNTEFITMGPG